MRVLVAGCGRLGSLAALELLARGNEVVGLKRDVAGLPGGVQPFAADLTNPETLASLPEVDQVIYCASAGAMEEARYRSIYVDGPRNLIRALAEQPVRRLVFTSSTAVYGIDDGSVADEATPCEPDGFRGALMLEGEDVIRDAPFPGVALRLAGIYGPGPGRLVDAVRQGRPCSPGRYTNRIHVADAARAAVHLLSLQDPEGVYLGVDDLPAQDCEVRDWLAGALGLPPVPRGERSGAGRRCSNARLTEAGFRLHYRDYRHGYGDILERTEDE